MSWNPFAFLDGLAAASAKFLAHSVSQDGALERLLGVDDAEAVEDASEPTESDDDVPESGAGA